MYTFNHGLQCIMQVYRGIINWTLDGDETCLFHDCDRRCVLPWNACHKQAQDTFQPSRLTGVRLWAVIALQTVWWEIEVELGHEINSLMQMLVCELSYCTTLLIYTQFYKHQLFCCLFYRSFLVSKILYGSCSNLLYFGGFQSYISGAMSFC